MRKTHEGRLKLVVLFLLLHLVVGKLLFLLLDAAMVDLLEITLLTEFVVGGAGFLGDDARLIELLLQDGELIGQLRVLAIDLGDLGNVCRQFVIGLVLAPLLLEGLESATHAKLDEEVPDELIWVLRAVGVGGHDTHLSGLIV